MMKYSILGPKVIFVVALLLVNSSFAQHQTQVDGWRVYSPSGSFFSMEVPSAPLQPQGFVFDPDDDGNISPFFEKSKPARVYNFEISSGGKRQFLVSILQVELSRVSSKTVLNESLARKIGLQISDEYRYESWSRSEDITGETARWNYRTQGRGEGTVRAVRFGRRIIIVVVDFDYADKNDPDIQRMLSSIRSK